MSSDERSGGIADAPTASGGGRGGRRDDAGEQSRGGQPGNQPGRGGQRGGQPGQPGQSGGQDRGPGPGSQQGGQPGTQDGRPGGQRGGGPGGGPPQRGGGGGSTGRRIGIVVLGILLTASVVLASGIVAGQQTALSSDYVADTLAETNATAQIEQRAEDRVLEQAGSLGGAGYIPNSDVLLRRTIDELITRQYVDRVVSTNLDRLYAYLKGQRPTLKLAIDTTPIIEDVRPTVRDQLRSIPVADLLQQDAFADALSLPGVEISTQKFARAYDDPQTFNEIQAEYSQLVEQPGVTQQDLVDEVISQTRPKVDDLPRYVQEAIFELERTFVVGFTNEDMSHEQFRQNVRQARNNFYDAVARYAQQQVAQQVEDPISITDQLSASNRQTLDQASGIVQLMGTLGVVLPLLALVLIAVIAVLTHSVSRTARVVGSGLLAAGVLGFVVGVVASGQVRSRIREELGSSGPQFVRETVQALVDGVFSALNTQNILIALIGAVLLGVYFYVDRKQPEAVPPDWR